MDPNKIRLFQATEQHAPQLLHIVHAAFEEYRGVLDPPSGVHAETLQDIRHKLETGGALMALSDGEPAGCVFYQPEAAHVYLGRLAVLPRYRRQGIGNALIQHVEALARELRVPRVQLGVRVALPGLRAHYEKLGYRLVRYGTHEGYEEPTYAILEKDLA